MSRFKHRDILPFEFLSGALNRDLKLLFVSTFTGAFGDGLYFFILPLYIRELGAKPVEVGTFFSVMLMAAAFTPLLGGVLADRYDRKKIMIAGWLVWMPVPILFSLAKNWVQLLPTAVLYGVWIGQPAFSAYIASSAKKEKATLTFTVLSASWSLGYIFSPALGASLSDAIGIRWVFYLSFILYGACTSILFLISSQNVVTQTSQLSSTATSFGRKKLLVWSVFFAVIMFFVLLVRPIIPQILKDEFHLTDSLVGILGSITFLGSGVLGIYLGRIGDKWKKAGAISVCMVLCSVSAIILVLFNNFFALSLASLLMGASYTTWSLIGAVMSRIAPEPSRARWISVPLSASMFAAFLAPYLGGLLYESSPYNPFLVFIVATGLLSVLALTKLFNEETAENQG
uniref:Major facilitator superfamily permease n=1 Tax=uncultured miscellaneous Crenarchaeota group TaxID=1368239 RepID=W8SHW9_9ARCH|nr:major facilitator superfamily permease [uncultured miscellaneous Crenarchaeota group]